MQNDEGEGGDDEDGGKDEARRFLVRWLGG